MSLVGRWKAWARAFKLDVYAVYLAARDPRVPWYAKALALVIAAYAFSPIDLIPDFIPVIGYADDLILLPLGVMLISRLVPDAVWEECRAKASHRNAKGDRQLAALAAVVVVLMWLGLAVMIWTWTLPA